MKRYLGIALVAAALTAVLFGPAITATYHVMYRELNNRSLVREVCSNCPYTTIQSAVDAITDASATNRYTIQVHPGIYNESVSPKSYITIVGDSKETVIICGTGTANSGIVVGSGITEFGIRSLTVGGDNGFDHAANSVAGVTSYADNCVLGVVDTSICTNVASIDTVHTVSNTGLRTITVTNSIHHSVFDHVALGNNTTYYGVGNLFQTTITSDPDRPLSFWRSISITGSGTQIHESGSKVRYTTAEIDGELKVVDFTPGSGSASQKGGVWLSGVDVEVTLTNASRTAASSCFAVGSVPANSNGYRFELENYSCRIAQTSSSGALRGMYLLNNDADLANTSFRWNGGRIELSGGASQTDVDNSLTAGGITVKLESVEHAGVYAGAGTTSAADARLGAFGTTLTIPVGTAPTISADGNIGVDTTANQFLWYSGAVRALTPVRIASVALLSPVDTDDPVSFKAANTPITITAINCIVDPADAAESVVITLRECDATADNCAGVDGATTITCDNDGATDDGSLSNPSIDLNDWVDIDVGTVTGTVSRLAITVSYTEDRQ